MNLCKSDFTQVTAFQSELQISHYFYLYEPIETECSGYQAKHSDRVSMVVKGTLSSPGFFYFKALTLHYLTLAQVKRYKAWATVGG